MIPIYELARRCKLILLQTEKCLKNHAKHIGHAGVFTLLTTVMQGSRRAKILQEEEEEEEEEEAEFLAHFQNLVQRAIGHSVDHSE